MFPYHPGTMIINAPVRIHPDFSLCKSSDSEDHQYQPNGTRALAKKRRCCGNNSPLLSLPANGQGQARGRRAGRKQQVQGSQPSDWVSSRAPDLAVDEHVGARTGGPGPGALAFCPAL